MGTTELTVCNACGRAFEVYCSNCADCNEEDSFRGTRSFVDPASAFKASTETRTSDARSGSSPPDRDAHSGSAFLAMAEALRIVHGCYDGPDSDEYHADPCDICPDDETRAAHRAEAV